MPSSRNRPRRSTRRRISESSPSYSPPSPRYVHMPTPISPIKRRASKKDLPGWYQNNKRINKRINTWLTNNGKKLKDPLSYEPINLNTTNQNNLNAPFVIIGDRTGRIYTKKSITIWMNANWMNAKRGPRQNPFNQKQKVVQIAPLPQDIKNYIKNKIAS